MKLINKENIKDEINLINEIKKGKLFIYPTDTIYGLGCDATNKKSVNKIKRIKKRDKNKPLSIIAPSKKWIKDNLIINANLNNYLPGPYTIILKKKNKDFLNHVSNTDSLGIRIPDNKITKLFQKSNKPFITTSVNLSGEENITRIRDIKKKILNRIDYIIDAGILNNKPSRIIINGKEVKR
jgi:L-threonylcarbamoyladenylate synthase